MGGCELEGKLSLALLARMLLCGAWRVISRDSCVQVPHAGLDPPKIIRFAAQLLRPLSSHCGALTLPCHPSISMVAHEGLRLELIGSASMPVSFADLFRDCTDSFPASRPTAAAVFARLQQIRNQNTGS